MTLEPESERRRTIVIDACMDCQWISTSDTHRQCQVCQSKATFTMELDFESWARLVPRPAWFTAELRMELLLSQIEMMAELRSL